MFKHAAMAVALALFVSALLAGQKEAKPKAKPTLSKDEQALFDLLTRERAKEKLPPLKLNAVLCEVARKHSANMARHDKMLHRLDDKGVGERVTDAGYDWRSVRENIAKASGYDEGTVPDPREIHTGWMESKGHRENILNKSVTEIGISMVKGKKGAFYYTQVFAAPLK